MGRHSEHVQHLTDRTIALTGLVLASGTFLLTAGLLVVAVMALPASSGYVVASASPSSSPWESYTLAPTLGSGPGADA